jgi:hypothetical protein
MEVTLFSDITLRALPDRPPHRQCGKALTLTIMDVHAFQVPPNYTIDKIVSKLVKAGATTRRGVFGSSPFWGRKWHFGNTTVAKCLFCPVWSSSRSSPYWPRASCLTS